MRKFVKVLALALALSLLFAAAALAASRARTLQDIKDSGTLVIGVFSDKKPFGMWMKMVIIRATTCISPAAWRRIWVWSLSWFPWMPPTAWSI